MAEYEGTMVQNDQYKIKKLMQQIKAGEERLQALQSRYETLDERYILETTDLKATIKRLQEDGIRIPKGRPKGFKPKPKGTNK